MRKAVKTLYTDLHELDSDCPSYDLNVIIENEDYKKVQLGFCPMNMEDRWFIYEELNEVYMYRSWTNVCIAKLSVKKLNSNYYLIYSIQIKEDENSKESFNHILFLLEELKSIFNINIEVL